MKVRRHPQIPFFVIFYSTTFTIFSLVLAALLLITLGDHIYQSFRYGQLYSIFVVSGVYFLTFAAAVFIYAGRLFNTRNALAHIPQQWSFSRDWERDSDKSKLKHDQLHQKESEQHQHDVSAAPKQIEAEPANELGLGLGMGRRIGRLVQSELERSVLIAYESTPRDMKNEPPPQLVPARRLRAQESSQDQENGRSRRLRQRARSSLKNSEKHDKKDNAEPLGDPIWGKIRHAGWSDPDSTDLVNVQFAPIIQELGNLIEAKAVSLAPTKVFRAVETSARSQDHSSQQSADRCVPDPAVVAFLTRRKSCTLAGYVRFLLKQTMITSREVADSFVQQYEYARFSGTPLEEPDFRRLLSVFAELLRRMVPLADDRVVEIQSTFDYSAIMQHEADESVGQDGSSSVRSNQDEQSSTNSNGTARHNRAYAQESSTQPLQDLSPPMESSTPEGSVLYRPFRASSSANSDPSEKSEQYDLSTPSASTESVIRLPRKA